MKIMLAEDSKTMRGLILIMLHRLGYKDVTEASNGKEAWKHLRTHNCDLLITDWNMPELSGIELLQKVRQDTQLADLPVIMLTSRNSREDIVNAVKSGINNYLVKPCNTSQLEEKIDTVMGTAKKGASPPAQQAQQFINNSRKEREGDFGPYVLCYEAPTDYEAFTLGKSENLLAMYQDLTTTLGNLNRQFPGMEMGYWIEHDSKEFTRLIKTTSQQIGLAIINLHRTEGIALSHFIGLKYRDEVPTFLLCDSLPMLTQEQKAGITKFKQQVIEREKLASQVENILRKHLIPQTKTFPSDLKLFEIVKGTGIQPVEGARVKVHYVGMLEDGSVFDSSHTTGVPLQFVMGQNQVVAGLQKGLAQMNQGGRAQIVVPPHSAYGQEGYEDIIPPDSTLMFNVELVEVTAPK